MGKVSDGYHSTLTDMRLNQKGFPRHIFMKHDKDLVSLPMSISPDFKQYYY